MDQDEIGGGAGEVLHCPVERGDVEAGGRRGWSVEDDRALLVNPVRRGAASGPAATVAVAVVGGGARNDDATSNAKSQDQKVTTI
jgi:hypothetical protein